MRKITSLLLTIAFVLSTLAFFAIVTAADTSSAVGTVASDYVPEGTGIASLDEATDPQGTYYLKNDITVNATLSVDFTGTIDGNGKTITVSAPIFEKFSGTMKNVTLAGVVDRSSEKKVHTGTVACYIPDGSVATFENVKNTATVNGSTEDYQGDLDTYSSYKLRTGTGGIVGLAFGSVTFKNCRNDGDITGYAVGGLLGYAENNNKSTAKIVVEDCVNNGKISDTVTNKVANNSSVGGLVGIINKVKGEGAISFKNCVNNGEVIGKGIAPTEKQATAGGIVGYVYTADSKDATCLFENVANYANITGSHQVGGIAGCVNCIMYMKNAVNKGNVESSANYASGIVCRVGHDNYNGIKYSNGKQDKSAIIANFEDCVNYGDVKSKDQYCAGISGFITFGLEANRCANYGKIDDSTATAACHAGGLFAYVGNRTITRYCFNYGDVYGATAGTGNYSVAGVIARSAAQGDRSIAEYCGNFGNVYGYSKSYAYGVAGVLGYAYGGNNVTFIRYCFNAGKVENLSTDGDASATGICSYFNASSYPITVENCFNIGEIKVGEGSTGVCVELWNSKSDPQNIIASGNGFMDASKAYSYSPDNKKDTEVVYGSGENTTKAALIETTLLSSGAVANSYNKAVNEAYGKDVFFQSIGQDTMPVGTPVIKIDANNKEVIANAVIEGEDGALANPTIATVPDGPSVDPVSPATGDATGVMFVLLAVSALACFGLALVPSKKHN